jgi:hypothetical protein
MRNYENSNTTVPFVNNVKNYSIDINYPCERGKNLYLANTRVSQKQIHFRVVVPKSLLRYAWMRKKKLHLKSQCLTTTFNFKNRKK